MDIDKLYGILRETCSEFRKGEAVTTKRTGNLEVTEVFAMPHESEAPANLVKVDVHFMVIGVDKEKAEARRNDFIEVMKGYPDLTRLEQGPSFIEVGGVVGDQSAALVLFALGEVLELWTVLTPERLHITDKAQADEMAGRGYIMMSPWKVPV